MNKNPFIAIIDDDYDDSTLLRECFQKFHPLYVHSFNKGSEFFDFIDHDEPGNVCLIVVDLNLPESSGAEIVKKIKETPLFKFIPVLVFTTGGSPSEKEICKNLDVEIFKKPNSIKEWESIAFEMASHCDPTHMMSNLSTSLSNALL